MIGGLRWCNDSHRTPVCQSVCQRLGGWFTDDDGPPLSGPARPHFATKPRAELASIDSSQHIWRGLRALRARLTKTTAGRDGADCGDLLSRPGTKHREYSTWYTQPACLPACLAAPDKNKARLMEFKWWYGGHCRLQNIHLQSVISKYWGVSTVKYPNIGGYVKSNIQIYQSIYSTMILEDTQCPKTKYCRISTVKFIHM